MKGYKWTMTEFYWCYKHQALDDGCRGSLPIGFMEELCASAETN